ncbi:MAG: hypothetical protein V4857_10155 [Pseudomonadota bacterium]
MLRSSLFKIASLCLLASAGQVFAQAPQSTPTPSPKLERVPESEAPLSVAPKREGGTQITEKREGGQVTEVQVKSGKSRYTMKPNLKAGNAQRGDAQSGDTRAPQWTVLEFDLGKKKQKTEAEAAKAGAVEPPPPPRPPSK